MEELDPILKDLGASALRPQETCSCTSHTLKYKKNMGLLLILTLVLILAFQVTSGWALLPNLLTITVSSSTILSATKRTK